MKQCAGLVSSTLTDGPTLRAHPPFGIPHEHIRSPRCSVLDAPPEKSKLPRHPIVLSRRRRAALIPVVSCPFDNRPGQSGKDSAAGVCLVRRQWALDAASRIALGALPSPTFPVGATITDGFVQQSSKSPRSTSFPIQRCPARRPTQL
jgi:hypothetical protein